MYIIEVIWVDGTVERFESPVDKVGDYLEAYDIDEVSRVNCYLKEV